MTSHWLIRRPGLINSVSPHDLQHGIPSKLADFKDYLEAAGRNIYQAVETYLPTEEDWSDLELALAALDVDLLIEDLAHFMGSYSSDDWSDAGHHDFQYELQNVVERLYSGLRTQFAAWIRQLPIPTPVTTYRRLVRLDSSAVFFTFNYTNILNTLYGIPPAQILHIHGRAALAEDELVLGHAWRPQDRKPLNDRADIEEIDTRLAEANNIIDEYFAKTFKRSISLIEQNRTFFQGLTSIEQVIVLGHSLSSVDAAYFTALLEQRSVATAKWFYACRDINEWPEKKALLRQLGVNIERAFPLTWDTL